MEESKELQKLYGFMQAFIYITVCIEILLFVHFPLVKILHLFYQSWQKYLSILIFFIASYLHSLL